MSNPPTPSLLPGPQPGAATHRNPYLPPGQEEATANDHVAMLRPWRNRLHHDFYVVLAAVAESHERFRGRFRDPNVVLEQGQLITVTGARGTGKSALLHRFAGLLAYSSPKYSRGDPADVSGGLPGRLDGQMPLIADLSEAHALNVVPQDATPLDEGRTKEQNIYEAVIADLKSQRKLTEAEADRLRTDAIIIDQRCRADVPRGYEKLADALEDKNAVLVVLLPPIDKVGELNFYLRMARKRLVFMAESVALADRADLASMVKGMHYSAFTHLRTGMLTAADIRRFIAARQNRAAQDGRPWVTVTDEVIEQLCVRFAGQTVEQLRGALCELCHVAITGSGVVDIALYREYSRQEFFLASAMRRVRRDGGRKGPKGTKG